MNDALQIIQGEITAVLAKVDRDQVSKTVRTLDRAGRVFVTGEGRSGLMATAFAMRLMHLDPVASARRGLGGTGTPPRHRDPGFRQPRHARRLARVHPGHEYEYEAAPGWRCVRSTVAGVCCLGMGARRSATGACTGWDSGRWPPRYP